MHFLSTIYSDGIKIRRELESSESDCAVGFFFLLSSKAFTYFDYMTYKKL